MMKRNYRLKRTISVRQFILELGENFSDKIKENLLKLDSRCVLTRKDNQYMLDVKHIEHIQHDCACDSDVVDDSSKTQKEYVYGQFVMVDGILYFSQNCFETNTIMQSPIVSTIYTSLDNNDSISLEDIDLKKVDDSNIEYIIDSILTVCPEVSQAHLDIVQQMTSLVKR